MLDHHQVGQHQGSLTPKKQCLANENTVYIICVSVFFPCTSVCIHMSEPTVLSPTYGT